MRAGRKTRAAPAPQVESPGAAHKAWGIAAPALAGVEHVNRVTCAEGGGGVRWLSHHQAGG